MSYAFAMSIDSILAEIDTEIARLTQVRSLLAGSGKATSALSERKTKKVCDEGAQEASFES